MLFILAVLLGVFPVVHVHVTGHIVPGALVLYCSRFHFVSFGSTSAPVDLSAWPSLANDFSRLAKRMSSQLLEIYRQLENISSFLLFILSHANGAPDRDFPLFSAAVELWRNHWILGKRVYFMQNTPWECAAGQAVGHRIGGASSAGGIPGARGCGGSLRGCLVPLGLIGDKFVELKGLTLPVLDLIK